MSITHPLAGIDDLITQIYQGPLEATPWQTFVRSLLRRTASDVAAITLRPARADCAPLIVHAGTRAADVAVIGRNVTEYQRLAHLDPLANRLRHPGSIYTLDEVIARDALVASEFYQKLLQPAGIAYQLGMCFGEPGGWRCQLTVMAGTRRGNFGNAEKQFFEALRPHLERALETYALLKRNELEKQIYRCALDQLTIGTVILDGTGKVIEANEIARDILRRNPCISLLDNALMLARLEYRCEFNQMLKRALNSRQRRQGSGGVEALRVTNSTGTGLSLLVRPAPLAEWYQPDTGPSVTVYLSDDEHRQEVSEPYVARLFGLTRSEAALATALANGLSLSEAAVKLELTQSSVRTYSKKIFAKLGISRQGELVRLILQSLTLLAGPAVGECAAEAPRRRRA